jgi:hypothetical protein
LVSSTITGFNVIEMVTEHLIRLAFADCSPYRRYSTVRFLSIAITMSLVWRMVILLMPVNKCLKASRVDVDAKS